MTILDIVFSNCYTDDHNAAMMKLVDNLQGVSILNKGTTAEGEPLFVVQVDNELLPIFTALNDADCLYCTETEM